MKLLAEYSAPEQAALRTEVCPEADDNQINYFLRVCHARSIDPFAGLLYMQRRMTKGKWKCSVQPTVDGSRAAAARSGSYAGSDEPEFDSEEAEPPKWCRVTVYRMHKGERCAYTAKCRWREFVPSAPNDFQWKAKPYHMLSKVTEVQALRKAFPEHVSATGEDDFGDETDAPPGAPSLEDANRARLAVEWSNAVKAFAPLGKTEANLLEFLKCTREQVGEEHMETLRILYEDKTRDK